MHMFFLSAVLAASAPASPSCERIPAPLAAAVNAMARDMRGAEYCSTRKVAHGDIDGDGRQDVAVIYTIEGGGRLIFQVQHPDL